MLENGGKNTAVWNGTRTTLRGWSGVERERRGRERRRNGSEGGCARLLAPVRKTVPVQASNAHRRGRGVQVSVGMAHFGVFLGRS